MRPTYLSILMLSFTALILPAAWNVYSSVMQHDWKVSSRFDGQAYVVSQADYVSQQRDLTGVAAVMATLLTWQGQPTAEAELHDLLVERDFGYRLAEFTKFATEYGFDGQWLQAEPAALTQLKTPYLAHFSDGGGRFVIVRDARSGYVYVTDPQRGQVVFPMEQFLASWSGQVFAFPEPPIQPEEWR